MHTNTSTHGIGCACEEIPYNEYLHEAFVDGHHVALTKEGKFLVDKIEKEWYKQNGKPWLVVKRGSFIGLVKQILRNE